jgi:hypothetical protein
MAGPRACRASADGAERAGRLPLGI